MHTLDNILHLLDRASARRPTAELVAKAQLDPAWDTLVSEEAAAIAAENAAAAAELSGARPGAVADVGSAAAELARNGYGLVMHLVGRPTHENNELPYSEFADELEALDWAALLPRRVLAAANQAAQDQTLGGLVAFDRHALLVDAFATGVAAAVVEHDLSTRQR